MKNKEELFLNSFNKKLCSMIKKEFSPEEVFCMEESYDDISIISSYEKFSVRASVAPSKGLIKAMEEYKLQYNMEFSRVESAKIAKLKRKRLESEQQREAFRQGKIAYVVTKSTREYFQLMGDILEVPEESMGILIGKGGEGIRNAQEILGHKIKLKPIERSYGKGAWYGWNL